MTRLATTRSSRARSACTVGNVVVDTVGDPRPLVLRHERDDAVDERRQLGVAEVHPQHAGLQPSGVEQVLDDQHQPVDLTVGEHDQLASLRLVERDVGGEQARGRQLGGRERRAQVVRDGPQRVPSAGRWPPPAARPRRCAPRSRRAAARRCRRASPRSPDTARKMISSASRSGSDTSSVCSGSVKKKFTSTKATIATECRYRR